MDCVYVDVIIFEILSNSEYQHINLEVSLNSEGSRECHWYFRVLLLT